MSEKRTDDSPTPTVETPTAAHKTTAGADKPVITSISPVGDMTIMGVPPGNIPAKDFDTLPYSVDELLATGHWRPNYSRGGAD